MRTMKLHITHTVLGLCLFLSSHLISRAATVWNGPIITYTQPAPDPTQSTNQDHLTANVALTRGSVSGMFNGVSETGYTHFVSQLAPNERLET